MPKSLVLLLSASTLLLLAALVGGVYAIAVFVESVKISPTLSPVSVRIALSGTFLAGAVLLYVAKNSRYQFGYGLLEVAVGIVFRYPRSAQFGFGGGLRLRTLSVPALTVVRILFNAPKCLERPFRSDVSTGHEHCVQQSHCGGIR